jgi:hypothetical protein
VNAQEFLVAAKSRTTWRTYLEVFAVALGLLLLLSVALLSSWNWQGAIGAYIGLVRDSAAFAWLWIALSLLAFLIGGFAAIALFEAQGRAAFRSQLRADAAKLLLRAERAERSLREAMRKRPVRRSRA